MSVFKLPTEILAQIVEYLDNPVHEKFISTDETRTIVVRHIPKGEQKDILSLRLVNKAFHRVATPVVFNYLNACFPFYDLPLRGIKAAEWGTRLLDISKSPVIEEVRTLIMGFKSFTSYEALDRCVFEAASILPAVVQACSNLTALRIYAPLVSMHTESSQDSFLKTVEQVLRRVNTSAGSCALQSLELTLPLISHFTRLADTSVTHSSNPHEQPLLSFMAELKHLHLDFSSHADVESKRYLRNAKFLDLVILPHHLHSLSISASYPFDMDVLDVRKLQSLRKLRLGDVQISQEILTDMPTRNLSTFKSLVLDKVALKSGTWEPILLEFCDLPHLEHFRIRRCGYVGYGTTIHRRRRVDDIGIEINPLVHTDMCALGSLQTYVNQVRKLAGFALYDWDE